MDRYGLFIGGEFQQGPESTVVRNPYDESPIAEVAAAGPGEIEQAIEAARKAFAETRRMSRAARSDILAAAAATIRDRAEDLADTIRREAGKPISLSRWEVQRCLNTFTLAAEEAKRLTGEIIPADILPRTQGYRALYERFPIGPVLGITPFNFPLNLVAHKIAPALATGNTIVVKPAPQTPISALKLGEIVQNAGAPRGAVNVVCCANEFAEKMVTDKRFQMLTFTGGARVGWHLKTLAGKKKVTLELGGNAGLVIEADADLATAAKKAAVGGFAYAGQACISVQRIYVQRRVYEDFLGRLVKEAEALPTGDPSDEKTVVGPMVSAAAVDRVTEWIAEARAGGARCLTGGRRKGNVLSPAILVDVKPTMRVSCEELFGPVVTVEPYDEFAEAVARVNDSPFGLQAGVFTRDYGKIEYAFEHLEVGAVLVNETSYFRIDNYPYGGIKDSGFGREGVRYAMESMTEPRVLVTAPA